MGKKAQTCGKEREEKVFQAFFQAQLQAGQRTAGE